MRKCKKLINKLLGRSRNIPLFIWNNRGPIMRETINKYLKIYLKKIGLQPSKYLIPHSFRYGCITDLMRAGVPDWLVKKFARHSPKSKMTFHYTQTTANDESEMISGILKKHKDTSNRSRNQSS